MKYFSKITIAVLVIVFSVSITNTVWAWGNKKEKIKFMSKDLDYYADVLDGIENGKDIEIFGKLTIPKKVSKKEQIPCMIYMHGSGGYNTKRNFPWLDMFHDMGIATFKIDSFTARGVTNTTGKQESVSSPEMAVDVYKALEVMSNHPRIDKNRIGIIGNSKGGIVSLITKWSPLKDAIGVKETFALHISLYGLAMEFEPFEFTDAPLLGLVGEKDNWIPAEPWTPMIEKMNNDGYDAEVVIYKNAHHAFDAEYDVKKTKEGHSYANCRFKLYNDGRIIETTTGLNGIPGEEKCRCETSGVMIGSNSKAKKASKIKAAEFVTRVFKLK
ncbi:MAG: dienelactone hydrolase family protein [Desulfobacteraceae bacterium]|nr:dienelactone hydrolase family protein [Desulfobacteraceae bacterium]